VRGSLTEQIEATIRCARAEGRHTLLETEGTQIARALGFDVAEQVLVASSGEARREAAYLEFPGEHLVVKVVSPQVLHKTDVGGVVVVPKTREDVVGAIASMERRFSGIDVAGYSLQRHVEFDRQLGGELLFDVRHTDDFGPVVTVAPGGVLTEYLAKQLPPGHEVAIFSSRLADRTRVRRMLADMAITPLVTGSARGQKARLTLDELAELVERLLSFADEAPRLGLVEFELNPVVLTERGPVALDALAKLAEAPLEPVGGRPLDKIRCLLEPRAIAVVGVSTRVNPGRIILDNLIREGFPSDRIHVVKPGLEEIAGCRCYPDFDSLPEPVDVAVLGIEASQIPDTLDRIIEGRRAESVILISSGLGETEGSGSLVRRIRESIAASRASDWRGPLVNGGNCLGIRSVPGRFDTLFIPDHKLPRPTGGPSPLAVVSQSGAFAVAKFSKLAGLNPRYVVSVGNQLDLTVGDYMTYLADDPDVEVVAFYVEGFRPLDGARWLDAVSSAVEAGKSVILYRAGRTPAGAKASASHTAALAGDYVVTRELARAAGAIVAETLEDFEDLTQAFCLLRDRTVRGWRLGAVSNAGFECVAVADNLGRFELAGFSTATTRRLAELLTTWRLDRVVDVNNPLDVTPIMADEGFAAAAALVLQDENVDLGLVGCVPLTGALATIEDATDPLRDVRAAGSVARRIGEIAADPVKPLAVVVDGGPLYDAMVSELLASGVVTFRTVDRALKILQTFCAAKLLRAAPGRS
jgi:acyl-CoA synthetase (NDP forming)